MARRARTRCRCCARPPASGCARSSGRTGLARANPLQLAEMANEVLDGLVAAAKVKPSLTEQRQLLRDVVETLRAERAAAAPAAPAAAEPAFDRLADPLAESAAKNAPEVKNKRELQVKAAGDAAADAAHRHLGRLGAGAGGAAQPDRRDRRGDHRRPEDPAQRQRAEVDRAAARGRHGRPRAARAAAQGRGRDRHHGQRPAPGLRRAQGQGGADRRRRSATTRTCCTSPPAS